MSTLTINPGIFATERLFDPVTGKPDLAAVSKFLNNLSLWAVQIQGLVTAQLKASAFTHVNVTTINGSTNCSGAFIVTASLAITATSTMTLNNVADATLFDLRITNSSGVAQQLNIAANKPGGGAYSVLVIPGGVLGAGETDMTATGFSLPTGNDQIYLRGIAQQTAGVIALGYV